MFVPAVWAQPTAEPKPTPHKGRHVMAAAASTTTIEALQPADGPLHDGTTVSVLKAESGNESETGTWAGDNSTNTVFPFENVAPFNPASAPPAQQCDVALYGPDAAPANQRGIRADMVNGHGLAHRADGRVIHVGTQEGIQVYRFKNKKHATNRLQKEVAVDGGDVLEIASVAEYPVDDCPPPERAKKALAAWMKTHVGLVVAVWANGSGGEVSEDEEEEEVDEEEFPDGSSEEGDASSGDAEDDDGGDDTAATSDTGDGSVAESEEEGEGENAVPRTGIEQTAGVTTQDTAAASTDAPAPGGHVFVRVTNELLYGIREFGVQPTQSPSTNVCLSTTFQNPSEPLDTAHVQWVVLAYGHVDDEEDEEGSEDEGGEGTESDSDEEEDGEEEKEETDSAAPGAAINPATDAANVPDSELHFWSVTGDSLRPSARLKGLPGILGVDTKWLKEERVMGVLVWNATTLFVVHVPLDGPCSIHAVADNFEGLASAAWLRGDMSGFVTGTVNSEVQLWSPTAQPGQKWTVELNEQTTLFPEAAEQNDPNVGEDDEELSGSEDEYERIALSSDDSDSSSSAGSSTSSGSHPHDGETRHKKKRNTADADTEEETSGEEDGEENEEDGEEDEDEDREPFNFAEVANIWCRATASHANTVYVRTSSDDVLEWRVVHASAS